MDGISGGPMATTPSTEVIWSACSSSSVQIKSEPGSSPELNEERDPESPPQKIPLATASDEEEVALSIGQLKRYRRNARDRRRTVAKKESMQRMRRTLVGLEQQMQQFIFKMGINSPHSSQSGCNLPSPRPGLVVATSTLLYPPPSISITRDDYVQLAAEIEELRLQNATMVQELARRDLFNNSISYQLTSFRPLGCTDCLKVAPLALDEGVALVKQTLEKINEARLLDGSEARFSNLRTFLGWNQYAERYREGVMFTVKKVLRSVTPQELMDRTWELLTDANKLKRLEPSHLQNRITILQKVSGDILVISLRTEDFSLTNESGKNLVFRSAYALFRAADVDGAQMIGIKTLDIPVADRMIDGDEVWWDICYWIRVSPENASSETDKMEISTLTEFGGVNTCSCEDFASPRQSELLFLAIRWETVVVAPFLLQS